MTSPLCSKALASFDESVSDLLQALMYNTQTTGNFAACIRVFLRRAAELKTSAQCDKCAYPNSLSIDARLQ